MNPSRIDRSAGIGLPHVRGLTLVELLTALAVGLLLVGAAAAFLIQQLDVHRRRLADARLTQNLHQVADLASRELRRAGHWGRADDGWPSGDGGDTGGVINPHAGILPGGALPGPTTGSEPPSTTTPAWSYGRVSADHPDLRDDLGRDTDETGALRLNPATQALDLRLSGPALAPGAGDQWQPLTDPARLRVSAWRITRRDRVIDLLAHCVRSTCAPGDDACPPQRWVRWLQIDLSGHDPIDPSRSRQVRRLVRVRNDELRGHCPEP